MVDLVKIRKKAKKQKEEEAASAAESPEPQSGSPAPGNQHPVPRNPEPTPAPLPPPATAAVPEEPRAGVSALPEPLESGGRPEGPSKLDRFKAEAGRRREVESGTRAEETGEAQLELLTFVIAGEQYAVDIERIVEIVTPRAVTRIPNTDPSVVGIMSLRGTIVTLVDVRRKLRHRPEGEAGAEARVIVVEFRNETVGFQVDRVLRVVKAAPGEVQPHPVVHSTELDEAIRGVFRAGGALTILLDLDKLLDHRALAATTA